MSSQRLNLMFGYFSKIRAKAIPLLIELWGRITGQPEFKPVNQNACRTDLNEYVTSLVNVDIPTWRPEKHLLTNVLDIILTLGIDVVKARLQSDPLFTWLMLAVAAGDVSKNTIKYIQWKISPRHAEQNQWFADAVGITVVSVTNLSFLGIDISKYAVDEGAYHILAIGSEYLLQKIGVDVVVAKKMVIFTSKYLVQALHNDAPRDISRQETLLPLVPQPNDNATQIPSCFEFVQENSSLLEGNVTQWAAISLLPTSSACQAYFNSSAIENFIKAQEHMCFYVKAFPGYGDLMAVINNYHHLREEMGFEGMATFIYDNNEPSYDNKAKIFRLLNLPTIEGDYSYHAAQRLEIIAESQAKNFTALRQGPLLFNCFTGWSSFIDVLISPHTGDHEKYMGTNKVFMRDDINNNFIFKQCGANNYHLVRQIGTDIFPLAAPVSTLEMAEDYFQTIAGQAVIKRTPALVDFVALLKSNTVNIMTAYGKTFSQTIYNLFNLILAANHAQKKLPPRPFVIAVMFPIDDKYLAHFNAIINGKAESVISLLKHQTKLIPQQLRSAIDVSGLRGNFSTLKISDGNAAKQLSNLRSGTITLVTFDALENVVFNAIYTGTVASDRNRPNRVLAAVGEGSTTFTTSNNAGVPRIHCKSYDDDEIPSDDLSKASPELRHRLLSLSKRACDLPLPQYWENYDDVAYKMIGEFLVDAHNPASEISRFFQQARHQIARGDRLRHAIFFVRQLLSMQQKTPDDHERCLHIEVEESRKSLAALSTRHSSVFNTTRESRVVELNPASNESAAPRQRIG